MRLLVGFLPLHKKANRVLQSGMPLHFIGSLCVSNNSLRVVSSCWQAAFFWIIDGLSVVYYVSVLLIYFFGVAHLYATFKIKILHSLKRQAWWPHG